MREGQTLAEQTTITGAGDCAGLKGQETPSRMHADRASGLCYNRNRYYDTGTGRYTSPDPLGLAPAPNPVAYVDNPTTTIDPLSLAPRAPDASGAAAHTAEDVGGGVARSPSFIVKPDGETVIEPKGAEGPFPVESGKGFMFRGGSGGHGPSDSAYDVRIMDPVLGGKYPKPNGYASYLNGGEQTINPWTGQTVGKSDIWWHGGVSPVIIEDLLAWPERRSLAAVPEADALNEVDALLEAALLDVRLDATTSSAWLLFDCRGPSSWTWATQPSSSSMASLASSGLLRRRVSGPGERSWAGARRRPQTASPAQQT